jgi:SAM-dependent methyltransferase
MNRLLLAFLITIPAFPQVATEANRGYQTREDRERVAATLVHAGRDSRQKPRELIAAIGIERGMAVADIGTGVGYMLPFLSQAVGPEGRVTGEDIFPDFLERARDRAKGLPNVDLVQGSEKDSNLPPMSFDLVLLLDAYHHFDYPAEMLAGIRDSLKPGGRLALVDFYRRPGSVGPDRSDEWIFKHIRIDQDEVVKEVRAAGFELVSARPFIEGSQYLLLFHVPAPVNALTPAERAEGWQLLFDGKTFEGWRDPSRRTPPGDAWTIEDGCIKARTNPRLREDLITTATFQDFELRFDWRIAPGSNSGVKYLVQELVFMDADKLKPGAKRFEEMVGYELERRPSDRARLGPQGKGEEYVISFEYQIIDDGAHADARRGPQYQAGALYSLAPASSAAARPVGEFNHSRIVLRGNQVEHWLNGVKVVDVAVDAPQIRDGLSARWRGTPVLDLLTRLPRRDCPIGLQNHGDAAWFRNIKIRPVPPPTASR